MLTLLDFIFSHQSGFDDPIHSDSQEDDRVLTAALKGGGKNAFDTLFDRYSHAVYKFAYKYLHSEEACKDVVQETFARLYATRDRLQPDKGIKNRIFTIALNCCYDVLKSAHTRKVDSLHALSEKGVQFEGKERHAEQKVHRMEMQELLVEVIESMQKKQKSVLLLKKRGAMTYKEIGEELGFSERYAKKLMKKAIEKIVNAFEKAGFTQGGMWDYE